MATLCWWFPDSQTTDKDIKVNPQYVNTLSAKPHTVLYNQRKQQIDTYKSMYIFSQNYVISGRNF